MQQKLVAVERVMGKEEAEALDAPYQRVFRSFVPVR